MKKLLQIFIIMFSLSLYKAQVKENIKMEKIKLNQYLI